MKNMKQRYMSATACFLALVLLISLPFRAAAAKTMWGDVNGDSRFSANDVVTVLQFVAGRDVAVTSTADVDGDGEIDPCDGILLLRGLAKPTLTVSGFDLDFNADTDYYLCYPQDFTACTIKKYTGFIDLTVSVEQYAGYCPYQDTAYVLGEPLQLGHGRARVTLTATRQDGSTAEYLIFLADPNPQNYACTMARITTTTPLRAAANSGGKALANLGRGARVYYLETVGSWCLVEQLYTGTVGYVPKSCLQWQWKETAMPEKYKTAISALQAAHPNWTFTFVDVEMTMEEAVAKYGAQNERYIDPLNYLNEGKIYAMLDISSYTPTAWTEVGIAAVWSRTYAIGKADAVTYFTTAAEALNINPYYVACRAALESGYGTSKFAKGTVKGYEGYYNFYGINCIDNNPTLGASYAKSRNWNSKLRAIVEGTNWMKDQYIDQGAVTPYFFRFAGFQEKEYMNDAAAPSQEAEILRRAYSNSSAKAHFVIPVYEE